MFSRATFGIIVFVISILVAEVFSLPQWVVAIPMGIFMIFGMAWMTISYNKKRFDSQTNQRRKIIRVLYDKNDSLEHIALVLSHSNFKDEDGKEIKTDHIQAEYDATIMLEELAGGQ